MKHSLMKVRNPYAIIRDGSFEPFDSLFDDFFNKFAPQEWKQTLGATPFGDSSYPKVNVVDYENHLEIEAELAGYSKEDVSIEVLENGILCISGTKSTKSVDDGKTYLHRELKRSKFSRSFTLGEQLDQKSIEAKFDNGLLVVTIPKLKKSEPQLRQKVEIK